MKIEEYKDEYLRGVVACLKRNFSGMSKRSDKDIIKWMDPLINYHWGPAHDPGSKRYSRGAVLLDDDGNVVGFSGSISSKQSINGKECLCGNMSTTAVDTKYRFCVGAMFRLFVKSSYDYDLLSGYTAREEVRTLLTKYMHYETVDTVSCKFLPFPVFGKRKVKINIIHDSNEIEQKDLRVVYDDHINYGVKCIAVSVEGNTCYLFYRVGTTRIKFLKCRGIVVLYSSDPVLCGRYAKDIIWALQKTERALLESDSRFFGGEKINYPMPYHKRDMSRLENRLNDNTGFFPYGLLYSELSILG